MSEVGSGGESYTKDILQTPHGWRLQYLWWRVRSLDSASVEWYFICFYYVRSYKWWVILSRQFQSDIFVSWLTGLESIWWIVCFEWSCPLGSKRWYDSTIPTRHDLLEEADSSALDVVQLSSLNTLEQFDDRADCINAITASLIIWSDNGGPDFDDTLKFKDDPGQAQVAGASSVLDPETFLDSLNVKAAQAQFS